MAKPKKKSLSSLVGQRNIDPNQIDKAVTKVHRATPTKKEKTIRVTVDTPMSLYLKCKEAALIKGQSLREYYLNSIILSLENEQKE